MANGRDIFSLTINASGELKLTLTDSIDHFAPDDLSISFPLNLIATDADNDQSPPEAITITVTDGIPTASIDRLAVTEEETITGNILTNDDLAADGGVITTLVRIFKDETTQQVTDIVVVFDPITGNWEYTIEFENPDTGAQQTAGIFTLSPNGRLRSANLRFLYRRMCWMNLNSNTQSKTSMAIRR